MANLKRCPHCGEVLVCLHCGEQFTKVKVRKSRKAVSFKIDSEVELQLRKVAEATGESMTDVVERAIEKLSNE